MDLDALQEMEEAWEDGAAAEGAFKQKGRCFSCGEPGHWANECPKPQHQGRRGPPNRKSRGKKPKYHLKHVKDQEDT